MSRLWKSATGPERPRFRRRRVPALLLIALLPGLSACAGGSPTGMPSPVLSQSEIEELAGRATAFAKDHLEAWPDINAFIADYTDDYTYADPTWSDYRVGSEDIVSMWRTWASMTDYTIDVTAEYVSTYGAAFEETWPGLQPPMALPPNPPVASGLTVYTFENGKVSGEDLWYRTGDNVAYGIGCFAVDDCPALQDTVDRYVTAWTDRDPHAIAGLYSQDAMFSDSLLSLNASGREAIGQLAESRFGSDYGLSIEVLDIYAWTAGITPPSDFNPVAGRLIGVAIHYRATREGSSDVQEAVATLELGVKSGTGIEVDPDGLIHRERVYHSPDTLLETTQ
jgi:ketosteroid isomerase-like protein